ncbi:MAG: transporter substrate-binding domain-containing protein [Pseudomonadota bacterium]
MLRSLLLAAGLALGAQEAAACQSSYTVQEGDSLFSIAEAQFGDLTKWSLIFYNNPQIQGGSLLDVPVGTVLTLPCPDGAVVTAPDPTPLQRADAEMKLITGSNYAPFTDLDWPGQGMLTELVNAALEATTAPVSYSITWENDWSKHLFPMLDSKEYDMGFPWFRPDCEGNPANERCANFHFSEPLVDLVILLFTRADQPMTYETDADIVGKRLCRPAGYFTHDLDRVGRAWISQGLITLEQPATPQDCFQLLMDGRVDAVALNEFTGVTTMFEMGLTNTVAPLPKPLSVEGLHVLISKSHWRGTTHLYRFNAGLAKLKQSERYNEIVSRHLALFWDQVREGS